MAAVNTRELEEERIVQSHWWQQVEFTTWTCFKLFHACCRASGSTTGMPKHNGRMLWQYALAVCFCGWHLWQSLAYPSIYIQVVLYLVLGESSI